jgi:hypothetical protein
MSVVPQHVFVSESGWNRLPGKRIPRESSSPDNHNGKFEPDGSKATSRWRTRERLSNGIAFDIDTGNLWVTEGTELLCLVSLR